MIIRINKKNYYLYLIIHNSTEIYLNWIKINIIMAVSKSKRIFYFDALRALAITCVIIIHVYAITRSSVMHGYGVIPSFEWIFAQV